MATFQSRSFIPFYIFLFFLGFYLITTRGILAVADSQVNFQPTRAMVETHSSAIDCNIEKVFIQMSPDGQCYGKYELGLAVSSIPLYVLARTFYGPHSGNLYEFSRLEFFVSTFNQFITAATCAVLYLFAGHVSGSRKHALEVALLFGICTIAWPYASLHLSQPFVGFLLLLAVFVLVRRKRKTTRIGILVAGLALGWACFTRLDTLPLALVISAYALYQLKQQDLHLHKILSLITLLLAPIILAVVVYFFYQSIRSGSWFQVGYEGEGWDTPFGLGLYGLLLSPGKGIIFYSPLIILAVIGLSKLWHDWQAEVVLIGGLGLVQLATYASWWSWEGGWTWGPRFLVSTQPLLMLGLLPWLERKQKQWLLLTLATLAFVVQVIGVATEPIVYLTRTTFTYNQTLFVPMASPILGQLQDLLQRRFSLLVPSRGYGILTTAETAVFVTVCLLLMATGGKQIVDIVAQERRS